MDFDGKDNDGGEIIDDASAFENDFNVGFLFSFVEVDFFGRGGKSDSVKLKWQILIFMSRVLFWILWDGFFDVVGNFGKCDASSL